MEASQQITFPPFSLDPINECLWRNGEALALTPKAYAVLRVLIDRAGQLVTKEALLQTVWPGTYVTDTALKVCINGIRTVLGDNAKSPHFIENRASSGLSVYRRRDSGSSFEFRVPSFKFGNSILSP